MAFDLKYLNELLKYVRAWSNSQWAWTLEGTLLLPPGNAFLAEKLSAIITFHRINWNLKTNTADQRIFKLLMHFTVLYSLDIVASMIQMLMRAVSMMGQLLILSLVRRRFATTFALF